jgi:hypothetical protein
MDEHPLTSNILTKERMDNGLGMNGYPISHKEGWGFFFQKGEIDGREKFLLRVFETRSGRSH